MSTSRLRESDPLPRVMSMSSPLNRKQSDSVIHSMGRPSPSKQSMSPPSLVKFETPGHYNLRAQHQPKWSSTPLPTSLSTSLSLLPGSVSRAESSPGVLVSTANKRRDILDFSKRLELEALEDKETNDMDSGKVHSW